MMMMMIHQSCAALLDHDDIIYSPFLFAVRCDLEQSASDSRRPPLPPPGLSPEKRKRKKERKRERERERERE